MSNRLELKAAKAKVKRLEKINNTLNNELAKADKDHKDMDTAFKLMGETLEEILTDEQQERFADMIESKLANIDV